MTDADDPPVRTSWGLKLPNCGGVLCPPEWARPDTILELAELAESHGFDAVWLHDHLVTPAELRHLAPSFYEPLVTMVRIASARPQLKVGVATIVLPLRDPVLLAKQVSTASAYFPGRFKIGVGAGRYASEFEALGLEFFDRRGSVAAESLSLLRALMTQDEVNHSGPTRTLRGASMNPRPVPRPPLLYAGNVPAAARRAARQADGWIGAAMSPAELAQMVDMMRGVRVEAGMGKEPFEIAYSATVVRDAADKMAKTGAGKRDLHLHAATLNGDADSIAHQLADFVSAGAETFQLSLRSSSLDEMRENITWFAEAVMPAVPSVGGASRA